jgi:hypothetical protein
MPEDHMVTEEAHKMVKVLFGPYQGLQGELKLPMPLIHYSPVTQSDKELDPDTEYEVLLEANTKGLLGPDGWEIYSPEGHVPILGRNLAPLALRHHKHLAASRATVLVSLVDRNGDGRISKAELETDEVLIHTLHNLVEGKLTSRTGKGKDEL